jgi:hypothetical protein
MTVPTTVPVQIEEDAAARIAELGLQHEFEMLIQHTQQTVANLRSIDVTRYDDPLEPGPPRVLFMAWLNGDRSQEEPVREEWIRWILEQMPPRVLHWISLQIYHWESYGR